MISYTSVLPYKTFSSALPLTVLIYSSSSSTPWWEAYQWERKSIGLILEWWLTPWKLEFTKPETVSVQHLASVLISLRTVLLIFWSDFSDHLEDLPARWSNIVSVMVMVSSIISCFRNLRGSGLALLIHLSFLWFPVSPCAIICHLWRAQHFDTKGKFVSFCFV